MSLEPKEKTRSKFLDDRRFPAGAGILSMLSLLYLPGARPQCRGHGGARRTAWRRQLRDVASFRNAFSDVVQLLLCDASCEFLSLLLLLMQVATTEQTGAGLQCRSEWAGRPRASRCALS